MSVELSRTAESGDNSLWVHHSFTYKQIIVSTTWPRPAWDHENDFWATWCLLAERVVNCEHYTVVSIIQGTRGYKKCRNLSNAETRKPLSAHSRAQTSCWDNTVSNTRGVNLHNVFECISACYNQHFPLSAFHLMSLDYTHDFLAIKYAILLQSAP